MATVFDSAFYFTDPYFGAVDGTVDGQQAKVLVKDGLDPERQGQLSQRPGHWARIYVLKSAVAAKPQPHAEVVIGDAVWGVDTVRETGDVYELVCLSNQRHQT